jgi:putative cardiolipin synthase
VAAVHAGYTKHRTALLRAGVKLYELKPSAAPHALRRRFGARGGSLASLHAKAFSVDRQRLFVGSFNLDPRSARLNAELVLAIDSPALAAQLSDALDRSLPAIAYEVTLTEQGLLQWEDAGKITTTEPEVGVMSRLLVRLLSLMPIDWLL